ncbi:MAG: hypothetical protein LBH60_03400 [Prevotellaceae bacterium]|jgi:hypothetical protein|nr:hypothetical protein [Prevotellaceae bacterium]
MKTFTKTEKKIEARREVISKLYKRGYTFREMQREVMSQLGIDKYSLFTVESDVKRLIKRWQEENLKNIDEAINIELETIKGTIKELWEQWELSKKPFMEEKSSQKGIPVEIEGEQKNGITEVSEQKSKKERTGNVAYVAEIRNQEIERRKLLGLYAPGKQEVTGKDGESLFPPSKIVVEFVDFSQEENQEQ